MKQAVQILVLMLALSLMLTGCGASWTPLMTAQMDEALCMEDTLLQGDTLADHGVLYDHGGKEQYNGYLDWWDPEVCEYMRGLYGDEALALLEQITDELAAENDPVYARNEFARNRFANTAEISNEDYDFILSEQGLFQAYRARILTELLRAGATGKKMNSIKHTPNDPIRVLLTEGSRYVGIDGKGIRSMADGDFTEAVVQRAKKIWSGLTSNCKDDFVLVSDPKAADVVIDIYVTYPFGGRYGPGGKSMTTTAFGCSISLIAVDLASDATAEQSFEVMPEGTISVRQISGVAWSELPELKGDPDAEAFMETVRGWYRDA